MLLLCDTTQFHSCVKFTDGAVALAQLQSPSTKFSSIVSNICVLVRQWRHQLKQWLSWQFSVPSICKLSTGKILYLTFLHPCIRWRHLLFRTLWLNLLTKPPDAATVPFLDVSTVHSRATSMHEPPRKFAYTFFRVSLLFSIVKQRKLAVSYDIVLNKPISLSLSCVWSY